MKLTSKVNFHYTDLSPSNLDTSTGLAGFGVVHVSLASKSNHIPRAAQMKSRLALLHELTISGRYQDLSGY